MNRRDFVCLTSLYSGGSILFSSLPTQGFTRTGTLVSFQPHPLIKLCDDGSVIVYVRKQEMGQGVSTSLPMIVAEEMEADWQKVKFEIAPFDYTKKDEYATWASDSIKSNWIPLRKAGAAAREMLITAASQKWNTDVKNCSAEKGAVINTLTGKDLLYKDLIEPASKLQVPQNPVLKSNSDFKIIGKGGKRINGKEIITGRVKYGIDVKLPGMVYALVLRCPVYGGKIKSYNAEAAKKIEGVKSIVEIKDLGVSVSARNGIAVVADSFWTAQKGRNVLQVEWDLGTNSKVSTEHYSKTLKQKLEDAPTTIIAEKGNAEEVYKKANKKTEASFDLPFLAHAAMEPINCTAQFKNGKYEVWGGFQGPGNISDNLPSLFGINKDDITINLTLMGGGFGRRSNVDYVAEAMQIAKAIEEPVKVYWTRADDMQNDFYRPAVIHKIAVSVDEINNLTSWRQHVSGTPFLFNQMAKEKPVEFMMSEGIGGVLGDMYYPVSDFKSFFHLVAPPVPCGAWRSIGYSHTTFAIECFIDVLAAKEGIDPFDYRIKLLSQSKATELQTSVYFLPKFKYDSNRLINVIKKATDAIGWNSPRIKGHHYGIACCPYLFAKSYAAHAFDISVDTNKKIKINRVEACIDCGTVVDPDGVAAQMEGAFVWALSAALRGEITLRNGKVQQSNFIDYGILRFNEMPPLNIHIINSTEDPGSVGEIGVPSVVPALCNAIYAATKYRISKLPISREGFTI